jgi:putative methyltransferase (TIGR04325 family)
MMIPFRKLLHRIWKDESLHALTPSDLAPQREVFSGNYSSWGDASIQCSGYDSSVIFDKAKVAALAVRDGKAAFERDTVLFYTEEFCWQTLSCLLHVASSNNGNLNVLDFGGALGSFYFQHKKLLSSLNSLNWSVVEQTHFVNFGASHLEDKSLRFYSSISDVFDARVPNVIYFGSVLEYLPDPFSILKNIFSYDVKNIIIDRTGFLESSTDRLTVQNVPSHIYDASYPAWFLSRSKFNKFIAESGFTLNAEWICGDEYPLQGASTSFRGYYYSKK